MGLLLVTLKRRRTPRKRFSKRGGARNITSEKFLFNSESIAAQQIVSTAPLQPPLPIAPAEPSKTGDDSQSTAYIPDLATHGANIPPAIASKRDYLFSSVPESVRWKIQVDEVALYSITEGRLAEQQSELFAGIIGEAATITDATACVGGNTISFAHHFAHVNSVELSAQRSRMLQNNVDVVGLHDKVTVYNGDYTVLMNTLVQDAVFFDPPWGGPDYYKSTALDMFLGPHNIIDIIRKLLDEQRATFIFMKAPLNYNERDLRQKLADVAVITKHMMHKMQIFVIKALDTATSFASVVLPNLPAPPAAPAAVADVPAFIAVPIDIPLKMGLIVPTVPTVPTMLTAEICNFTPYSSAELILPNIISLTLFKLPKFYKDFQVYVDGMMSWVKFQKIYFPEFQMKLAIDDNIANDASLSAKLTEFGKVANIVKFNCPRFYGDDGYHKGLFGSMVRFLPMFDISNSPKGIVVIQDIEPGESHVAEFSKLIHNVIKVALPVDFFYYGLYEQFSAKSFPSSDVKFPYIYAGKCASFTRLPIEYFNNFMEQLESGKFDKAVSRYKNNKKRSDFGVYDYGIDEIYLNDYLLPELIKTDKIVAFSRNYNIAYILYEYRDEIAKYPKTLDILRYVLHPLVALNKIKPIETVDAGLVAFDKTFVKTQKSDWNPRGGNLTTFEKDAISLVVIRYYKILRYMISTKSGWLPIDIMQDIINNYDGVIVKNMVVYTRQGRIIAKVPYVNIGAFI